MWHQTGGERAVDHEGDAGRGGAPGKRSLTALIQRRASSPGSIEAATSTSPPRAGAAADPFWFAGVGASCQVAVPGATPMPAQIATGGGAALDAPVQAKMEGAFGADFANVRVHADSRDATAFGAEAFAYGDDVHFAPGRYQPGSEAGQELLGHELTHVVQQRAGRVAASAQARGIGINQDAGLEAEADRCGALAARGESVSLGGGAHGGAPVVQGVRLWSTQGNQVVSLPGDVPPPWLGDDFFVVDGVFYGANEFPWLGMLPTTQRWTRPSEIEIDDVAVEEEAMNVEPPVQPMQPPMQPPMLPPPQQAVTTFGGSPEFTAFGATPQAKPPQPPEATPRTSTAPQHDPDVVEAANALNSTPRMGKFVLSRLRTFVKAAKDAGGLQALLDARQAHIDNKLLGFERWLRHQLKSNGVGNLVFELREALRQQQRADAPVQIDNDCDAQHGDASIDMLVYRDKHADHIERSVEVMGYSPPLDSYAAFFEGVRQGADHLISKLDRNASVKGIREATVAMAFTPEQDCTAWAKRAVADLTSIPGIKTIDRVNLVTRSDGALRHRMVNDRGRWSLD